MHKNSTMTEKEVSKIAESMLKGGLQTKIEKQFTERTGKTKENTKVVSRLYKGELRKVVIDAPRHLFMQNFGFEGVKKNGVMMRLKAKKTIDEAISESNIIPYLADSIAEIRGDNAIDVIKWNH